MESQQVVSVVIVTYNVEKFIDATLQSLCDQSFKNFEVIIIDDGSTDSTVKKILSYSDKLTLKLTNSEHIGNVGMQRNIAIKLCRGQYIHFLDGDDTWDNTKLEETQKIFDKDYRLVCTNARVINNESKVLNERMFDTKYFDVNIKLEELIKLNFIINSSAAINKDIVSDSCRFEQEEGFKGEDYIFWLKILENNSAYFIDKTLVNYRIHTTNLSYGSTELRIGLLKKVINIRNGYFNYNDSLVQKNARLGCNDIYKELASIYFKKRSYIESYKYLNLMSLNPKALSLRAFLYFGSLYLFLSLINLLKRSKS